MIKLTDLRGEAKWLKASLIREIRNVPDTVLIMLDGNCFMVRESVEEVLSEVMANPRSLDFRTMEALS